MYTNMLSNFPNFDIISKNIYNIQSYEGTDVASTSFLLKLNDWCVWAYMLSELGNQKIEVANVKWLLKSKFYRMLPLSLLLTLLSSIFLFSEGLPAKRVSSKEKKFY